MNNLEIEAKFLGPDSQAAVLLHMQRREAWNMLIKKYKVAASKNNITQQTVEKIMEARTKSKDKKLESAVINKPKSKKLEVDRLMEIVRSMHS